MENTYSKIMYNKTTAFPRMMVNRRKVEDLTHAAIFAYENEIKSNTASVAVQITPTWDKNTRKIGGTMTAKFESAPKAGKCIRSPARP